MRPHPECKTSAYRSRKCDYRLGIASSVSTEELRSCFRPRGGNLSLQVGTVGIELQSARVGAHRILRSPGFHVTVADTRETERARQLLAIRVGCEINRLIISLICVIIAIEPQIGSPQNNARQVGFWTYLDRVFQERFGLGIFSHRRKESTHQKQGAGISRVKV